MRSSLENSQTALVKLVQEMETLLDAEREKVSGLENILNSLASIVEMLSCTL